MDEYRKFLNQFRCEKGSGIQYTHTSIGNPRASYAIPVNRMSDFYEAYNRAMVKGVSLHLTEKPCDPSPMRADLDFRFPMVSPKPESGIMPRLYTQQHVTNIVKAYCNLIANYVDPSYHHLIIAYVMEKNKATEHRGKIKDGIHIVWPHIVLPHTLHHLIRKHMLNKAAQVFIGMPMCNTYEEIIDNAIIDKNNWQMYGSKKPECEAYRVTYVYKYEPVPESIPNSEVNEGEEEVDPADVIPEIAEPATEAPKPEPQGEVAIQPPPSAMEELNFARLFSMRDKQELVVQVRADKLEEVDQYIRHVMPSQGERRKTKLNTQIFGKSVNMARNCVNEDDFILSKELVECLNPKRSENYEDWIKLGWTLRNIDHRLLDAWVEFSRVSSKYVEGECNKLWNTMRTDTLGMGTLRWWARQDNPQKYEEIRNNNVIALIDRCCGSNGAHYDVACVVHALYKDKYRYTVKDTWYMYMEDKHRWVRTREGLKLRMNMSIEIWRRFAERSNYWSNESGRTQDQNDQERFNGKSKTLLEICTRLKTAGYKDSVMKECKALFTDENFEEILDSHSHLVGFENGVYDLRMHEFREGLPDDFISFTTGRHYMSYDPDSAEAQEVEGYLAQVFTNANVRNYMKNMFSCIIDGSIRQEKFYIFTGQGSNSKSLLLNMVQRAVGDYYCILPIALLTQKRTASNAAQSELERTKGRRCAVMQEPGDGEKMNIGLMKELSGGDRILTRGLFKEPIEFKPQFKMIMTCNELPEVPSDDGGTWRRIRVIEFTSRFVDKPDPSKQREFPIDPDITDKLDRWADTFISMIIDHHKRLDPRNIEEPLEVRIATEGYKKNNDIIGQFIVDRVVHDDTTTEKIQLTKFFTEFKGWAYHNVPKGKKLPDRTQMRAYLEKTFGVYPSGGKGWKGLRIKSSENTEAAEEDETEAADIVPPIPPSESQPKATPKGTPKTAPKGTPKGTPKPTPKRPTTITDSEAASGSG